MTISDSGSFVRIDLPAIYEKVVNVERIVANLATNATHAESWRNEADRDIRDLTARSSLAATRAEVDAIEKTVGNCVTRRELYSVVGLVVALVSAASPFLSQLYTR